MAIYDSIGQQYNRTRKADPYLGNRLLNLLEPKKDKLYLDLGCGSGNYTRFIANKEWSIIGIDPSQKMLDYASATVSNIKWMLGSSENIPLPNSSVDGVIITLSIHHWKDLSKSALELNRVLKPSAKIIVFTSSPEQMKGYWLNHYFPKMMDSAIKQMPSIEIFTQYLKGNFSIVNRESYFVKENLEDHFLYVGKHCPQLYLNPNLRQGISSFTALSNHEEVSEGLKKLEADIKNNRIQGLIKSYENDLGDYSFLVFRKN